MNLKNLFSIKSEYSNRETIILRDYLALERTKLANERTLMSYIRSSLYLLLGGIGLLQLQGFERIHFLGYVSLSLTVLFMIIGIYRYYQLRQRLNAFYIQIDKLKEMNDENLKAN